MTEHIIQQNNNEHYSKMGSLVLTVDYLFTMTIMVRESSSDGNHQENNVVIQKFYVKTIRYPQPGEGAGVSCLP